MDRLYGVTAAQVATVAQGYDDGTFRPSSPVLRAQFAKMALFAFGHKPADPKIRTFADVSPSNFYYPWIEGGVAAGIISRSRSYRPLAATRRAEASSLVAACLVRREMAANGRINGRISAYLSLSAWYKAEGSSVLRYFADRKAVPTGQAPAMAYLIYRGVVQGDAQGGDLFLDPAARLTRAQAAVLILRAEAVELRPAAHDAPTVTGLGPVEGLRTGAGPVVIVGSGFQGATSVTFGHRVIRRSGFTVDSDTQITVKTAPAGSGTVHVSVATPLGRSPTGSRDTYSYLVSLRAGDRTVTVALRNLGVPYVWAGDDADGFDCSGLVRYVFAARGVSLPHSAALQYPAGTPVARDQLRPGDLVFFYHPIHHVAVYLGNGNMITAPRPGTRVCIERVLWSDFAGASRISG